MERWGLAGHGSMHPMLMHQPIADCRCSAHRNCAIGWCARRWTDFRSRSTLLVTQQMPKRSPRSTMLLAALRGTGAGGLNMRRLLRPQTLHGSAATASSHQCSQCTRQATGVMAEARLGPSRLTGAYAWASIVASGARFGVWIRLSGGKPGRIRRISCGDDADRRRRPSRLAVGNHRNGLAAPLRSTVIHAAPPLQVLAEDRLGTVNARNARRFHPD